MISLAALATFETSLVRIAQDYSNARLLTDRRGAIHQALNAVLTLMGDIGLAGQAGPIFEVAAAIATIDKGVTLPLIEAGDRPPHAPKLAEIVRIQRSIVAAAMQQRFDGKRGRLSSASREVAQWLTQSAISYGVTNMDSAIRKWRHEVTTGASDDLAKSVYDYYTTGSGGASGAYLRLLDTRSALLRELEIWGITKNPYNP